MKTRLLLYGAVVLVGITALALTVTATDEKTEEDPVVADPLEPVVLEDPEMDLPQHDRTRSFLCRCILDKELGLTEEQEKQLEDLKVAHQKIMLEMGADLKIAQMELGQLMEERGNDDAVKAKSAEITALLTKIREEQINHKLATRAIFTDEQWTKISKLKKYVGRHSKGRGHSRGFDRSHFGGRSFHGRGMRPGRRWE